MDTFNTRDFARDAIGSGVGFWIAAPLPTVGILLGSGIYASVKQVVPQNLDKFVDWVKNDSCDLEDPWSLESVMLKVYKVFIVFSGAILLYSIALNRSLPTLTQKND